MHWKYLFFDLDGTLTDPMQGITRSVQYALHVFGIEVTDLQTLCPFIGPPLRDSFMDLYDMDISTAEAAVGKYREYYRHRGIFENELYPGIRELLGNLQQTGAVNVMATSKPTEFAEQIARHFGLESYFTLISGSTMDNTRTSKADVIRYALDRLQIAHPAQAVMIGDRVYDIEGAAQTGLDSIGVGWGYGSRSELSRAQPTFIVDDVDTLHSLLTR